MMMMQGSTGDRPAWDSALVACMADLQQQGRMSAKCQASADSIRKEPQSPEAWQAFLQQVQSAGADSTSLLISDMIHYPGCRGLPFLLGVVC